MSTNKLKPIIISLCLPRHLLDCIKKVASRCDVAYQDLIKIYLYQAVRADRP